MFQAPVGFKGPWTFNVRLPDVLLKLHLWHWHPFSGNFTLIQSFICVTHWSHVNDSMVWIKDLRVKFSIKVWIKDCRVISGIHKWPQPNKKSGMLWQQPDGWFQFNLTSTKVINQSHGILFLKSFDRSFNKNSPGYLKLTCSTVPTQFVDYHVIQIKDEPAMWHRWDRTKLKMSHLNTLSFMRKAPDVAQGQYVKTQKSFN